MAWAVEPNNKSDVAANRSRTPPKRKNERDGAKKCTQNNLDFFFFVRDAVHVHRLFLFDDVVVGCWFILNWIIIYTLALSYLDAFWGFCVVSMRRKSEVKEELGMSWFTVDVITTSNKFSTEFQAKNEQANGSLGLVGDSLQCIAETRRRHK